MNEAEAMRVMVSLNLADIMTAIRPTNPQHVYDTPNGEPDLTNSSQESQVPSNSEPLTSNAELTE